MPQGEEQQIRDSLPPELARRATSVVADGSVIRLVFDVAGMAPGARTLAESTARAAIAPLARGRAVRIAMTAERAAAPAQAAPAAPAAPAAGAPANAQRRLIAVASGKGGVGKSTLAANLAVALARMGRRVGLVDADIQGPSQARLLSAGARPTAEGQKLIPVPSRYGVPLLSMAQLVEPDKAIAWRGPMVGGALGQLIDAEWGDRTELVVDLPPGTGDVQLTMIQRHRPAGAVIVSTPQDLALIDAARAIQLFEQTQVPIIGLVENMSGYRCPHCGEVSDPFGEGGAQAAAERLGIPFLGRIPLTMDIRIASDAGVPPAWGEGAEADLFAGIAAQVGVWLDARQDAA